MSHRLHQREKEKEETALGKRKNTKATKGDQDPFEDDDDDDVEIVGQGDTKRAKTGGGLFAAELEKQRAVK